MLPEPTAHGALRFTNQYDGPPCVGWSSMMSAKLLLLPLHDENLEHAPSGSVFQPVSPDCCVGQRCAE